ncbi:MAG: hypothetical protein ABSG26_09570 [Bryobacteraceae bacterium]
MSHTVSPEQLAANRANAAKSTGPRTSEGKHRSAQNARKHGFTASSFAVGVPSGPLEDLDEVANLREDLIAVYHPANSQELFALERIALAQQAILRAARLESGFFTACLNESCDPTTGDPILLINEVLAGNIEITKAQNRNLTLGDGFHRLIRQTNSFALLLRYQAQAERQYRRAIEEFDRLKALREELRNEANFAEPETNETTCTPCETNPIPSPRPPTPGPQPPAPGPHPPQPPTPDPRPLARAVDYHVGVQALEPIPGGPPCIEH